MKKLFIIILFITIFIFGMAASEPKDYSEYATNTLVSSEMASKMLKTERDLVILDIRDKEEFEKEHIRGSYQILRSDLFADKGEYKYDYMRAAPRKIAKILGSYGITSGTHILLLDAGGGSDATRLWWILDIYGHKNISIIDGGIEGWKSKGLKVVEGTMKLPIDSTIYKFKNSTSMYKSVNLEDVKIAIKNGSVILDTRSYLKSDGLIQKEKIFAKGRIPGSYNIPWDVTVDKDKRFKSLEKIKIIFDGLEVRKNMPIILYSDSGLESAQMSFVLRELLGYKKVENYDGSWAQWSYELAQGNVEIEKDNIFKILFSYLVKREKLESVITMLGIWGPLVYILMYIFIALTISPALPITVAGGIIFGPVMGVIYTAIGAGIGLSLSFLIARYIAREAIERKFGNTAIFKKIDEGVKKDGWFILAVTRLVPIFPFGIQNYVYGLTSIGFMQYAILSTIFILPGSSIYVMLAGAFTSGDKEIVLRYSITASLIFMGLMVVTKIIKKKWDL